MLGLLMGLGIAISGQVTGQEKPTIAVLPFIVNETIRIQVDGTTIRPTQVETEFTSYIMEFLVKSGKFNVLERDYLNRIIRENKITESDYAKPGEDQRIGKLIVADYLVIGNLDRVRINRRITRIPATGEVSRSYIAECMSHFRITEVKSGKVVFSHRVFERLKSKDLPFAERKDLTVGRMRDILFQRAGERAGNAILEGIFPIKVISVHGDQVMLNRGEGAGIKVGNIYKLYKVGETIKDPDTGAYLGSAEIKIGEIEVTEINPKFSKAKVLTADSTVRVGAICRSADKSTKKVKVKPRLKPKW